MDEEICRVCGGSGEYWMPSYDNLPGQMQPCRYCAGTGLFKSHPAHRFDRTSGDPILNAVLNKFDEYFKK